MNGPLDFQYISLDSLSLHPLHPRRFPNQSRLLKLTESIRIWGILTPLLVAKTPAGFLIINGARRWKAAKIAGFRTVPCVVTEARPSDLLFLILIENLEKESLNILDLAGSLNRILKETDTGIDELAVKLGLSLDKISGILKVLDLPDKFKKLYLQGKITAKELLKLGKDPDPLKITRELN